MTWPAPRAQATSFHSLSLSLSPPALLLSVPLPLLSVFLSIPRRRRCTPGLASAPPLAMAWRNPGGRGLGRSTMARWSPASLGAGAADKRPLCQLKKRLSQDPPSPPNTGSAGLRAKEGCLWITRVFSSPLLWFIASLRTQGNLFSNINIPLSSLKLTLELLCRIQNPFEQLVQFFVF